MPEELSGPQLFLRYAFPCVQDRLHAGLISQYNFDKLKSLVEKVGEPDTSILQRCFPNAVKDLETFSRAKNKDMWSSGTVAKLWRYHHGHSGDCAVKIATVCSLNNMSRVVVTSGSKIFSVLNIYNLGLEIGESVSVHRRTIIEKIG